MKDFINRLYRNHSLIYKGLLFICATFLIVYLFPKSGKFKYDFEKGKPWQSESLQAPFDFAIKKSDDEIKAEKKTISDQSVLYFNVDNTINSKVDNLYVGQFKNMFSDSIPKTKSLLLFTTGKDILSELYTYGILSENYEFPEDKSVVILDDRVKKQTTSLSNLITQDEVSAIIDKHLSKHSFSNFKTAFVSLFFDIVEPNLVFDKAFTKRALQEELSKIAYVRGSVEKETLIISKGEVVEGDKFQKLKSLQSEYESQVWNEANYNWILFAYTLLVSLALLMLLLFLRKYRSDVFENNTKVTFIFFNILAFTGF